MLNNIKTNKTLKILSMFIITIFAILFGIPIFQILIEIISKAGRITGTFIRTFCNFC